jgi:TatA/E family protein of Tat protein translocase
MPSLGPLEIVVIAVVALLVFGPKRLPEVGRQVGRAMRELRKFQDSVRDELHGVMNSMDTGTEPDRWEPTSTAPVVPPPSTSIGEAVPAPNRQAAPARPGGAQAPSRYRTAARATAASTGAAAASSAAASTGPTPDSAAGTPPVATPAPSPSTPPSGARAPSRYRAPNR